jgi:hypothetical protein
MLTDGKGGRQGNAVTGFLMKNRQNDCQNVIFWGHVRSSKRLGRRFAGKSIWKKLSYFISFPAIWGQSQRGQLWPHPVQLGLKQQFNGTTYYARQKREVLNKFARRKMLQLYSMKRNTKIHTDPRTPLQKPHKNSHSCYLLNLFIYLTTYLSI